VSIVMAMVGDNVAIMWCGVMSVGVHQATSGASGDDVGMRLDLCDKIAWQRKRSGVAGSSFLMATPACVTSRTATATVSGRGNCGRIASVLQRRSPATGPPNATALDCRVHQSANGLHANHQSQVTPSLDVSAFDESAFDVSAFDVSAFDVGV
jgi:hypothetical protein